MDAKFSAVSNLVLGFATGLMAFQASALAAKNDGRTLATASIVFLVASTGAGLWCAWNRLQDFRLSAKNARGDGGRVDTSTLGDFSWQLLGCQLWLFGIGALFAGLRVVL